MLSIILVQDFCPLKIKITQCPGEFCLNRYYSRKYGNQEFDEVIN